jgi:hypothetical protein
MENGVTLPLQRGKIKAESLPDRKETSTAPEPEGGNAFPRARVMCMNE